MMLSSQNVAIVKIHSCSRVMAFSNNCLLVLFSWERGFLIESGGTGRVGSHRRYTTSRRSLVRKHTQQYSYHAAVMIEPHRDLWLLMHSIDGLQIAL